MLESFSRFQTLNKVYYNNQVYQFCLKPVNFVKYSKVFHGYFWNDQTQCCNSSHDINKLSFSKLPFLHNNPLKSLIREKMFLPLLSLFFLETLPSILTDLKSNKLLHRYPVNKQSMDLELDAFTYFNYRPLNPPSLSSFIFLTMGELRKFKERRLMQSKIQTYIQTCITVTLIDM